MLIFKKVVPITLAVLSIVIIFYACKSLKTPATGGANTSSATKPRVLVFAKTAGFYHTSIPSGMAAIQKLGNENNFLVDTTRNSADIYRRKPEKL